MFTADLRKRLKDGLHNFKKFRKIHYIELLIFVFYLAQGLRASANFPSLYAKVCREMYATDTSICEKLKSEKSAENSVQKETARWLMYNEAITFLPNLLTAMFFGSYGDKYGRKVPCLVAIASMVVHNFVYMLFVSVAAVPVYAMVIEAGVIALFGTKTVFVAAEFSDAADQTEDEEKLTQRYSILNACLPCGIFVAGNLSPLLLKHFSLQWIMITGQIVMTVDFGLALLFRCPETEEQRKHRSGLTAKCDTQISAEYESNNAKQPERNQKSANDKSQEKKHNSTSCVKPPEMNQNSASSVKSPDLIIDVENSKTNKTANTKLKQIDHFEWLRRTLILYKSAWHALSHKRPNRGRCHLLAFCFVGLVYSCADSGMDNVTTLYVYREPISWTPDIFSRWMATVSVVQLIGGIVGTLVLKRLHSSDYTLLLVGLTSAVLKMATISVATKTWMMFLATALGCLSAVGASSVRSLVVHLGTGQETGELTSMLSIVMGWSQLTGSLLCNNIYTATLNYFAGSTFAVVAALLVLCLALVIFVMHDVKKCKLEQRTPTKTARIVFISIEPTL